MVENYNKGRIQDFSTGRRLAKELSVLHQLSSQLDFTNVKYAKANTTTQR